MMTAMTKEDSKNETEPWDHINQRPRDKLETDKQYKWEIKWVDLFSLTYFHLAACYGLYLAFTSAKWATLIYAYFLHVVSVLGEYGGSHRLWSHRSYKANLGLRIFLMLGNSLSFVTILSWARHHRVHHKYADTDADPYNSRRGFFFSHVGWIVIRGHPSVYEKGRKLDISDLYQDPVVMFQKRFKFLILPVMSFLLPLLPPVYLWSESWHCSWYVAVALRIIFHGNGSWLVNSLAHSIGNKPYDKHIQPTESPILSVMTLGEGWHNYHHSFPWDFRAAEIGNFRFNLTSWFISWCAKMGWAWDLKTVNKSMIQQRAKRTGDGTYGRPVWGWGDNDMTQEEKDLSLNISTNH